MGIPLLRKFTGPLLAGLMAFAAAPAAADNAITFDVKHGDAAIKTFTPGRILIWSCPSCNYKAEVLRVRRAKLAEFDPGQTGISIQKDLLIAAREGVETLEKASCATPETPEQEGYNVLGEYADWVVDVTYTFYSPGNDGEFENFGRLVGVTNNPTATLTLSKEALRKVRECAETVPVTPVEQ